MNWVRVTDRDNERFCSASEAERFLGETTVSILNHVIEKHKLCGTEALRPAPARLPSRHWLSEAGFATGRPMKWSERWSGLSLSGIGLLEGPSLDGMVGITPSDSMLLSDCRPDGADVSPLGSHGMKTSQGRPEKGVVIRLADYVEQTVKVKSEPKTETMDETPVLERIGCVNEYHGIGAVSPGQKAGVEGRDGCGHRTTIDVEFEIMKPPMTEAAREAAAGPATDHESGRFVHSPGQVNYEAQRPEEGAALKVSHGAPDIGFDGPRRWASKGLTTDSSARGHRRDGIAGALYSYATPALSGKDHDSRRVTFDLDDAPEQRCVAHERARGTRDESWKHGDGLEGPPSVCPRGLRDVRSPFMKSGLRARPMSLRRPRTPGLGSCTSALALGTQAMNMSLFTERVRFKNRLSMGTPVLMGNLNRSGHLDD